MPTLCQAQTLWGKSVCDIATTKYQEKLCPSFQYSLFRDSENHVNVAVSSFTWLLGSSKPNLKVTFENYVEFYSACNCILTFFPHLITGWIFILLYPEDFFMSLHLFAGLYFRENRNNSGLKHDTDLFLSLITTSSKACRLGLASYTTLCSGTWVPTHPALPSFGCVPCPYAHKVSEFPHHITYRVERKKNC